MGMEIGARIKESEKMFGFAPVAKFEEAGFEDTDIRCTSIMRNALAFAGINFREIDAFLVLPLDQAPKTFELVKSYKDRSYLSNEEKEIVDYLIDFLKICIDNNYYITIG